MVAVRADVVRTPRVSEDERACAGSAVEAACRLQLPPCTDVALALSNSHLDRARRAVEAGDPRVVEQVAVGCLRAPPEATPRRRRGGRWQRRWRWRRRRRRRRRWRRRRRRRWRQRRRRRTREWKVERRASGDVMALGSRQIARAHGGHQRWRRRSPWRRRRRPGRRRRELLEQLPPRHRRSQHLTRAWHAGGAELGQQRRVGIQVAKRLLRRPLRATARRRWRRRWRRRRWRRRRWRRRQRRRWRSRRRRGRRLTHEREIVLRAEPHVVAHSCLQITASRR